MNLHTSALLDDEPYEPQNDQVDASTKPLAEPPVEKKSFSMRVLEYLTTTYDKIVEATPMWLRKVGSTFKKLWFGFSYTGWIPSIFFPPMWIPYLAIAAIPLLCGLFYVLFMMYMTYLVIINLK